MFLLVHIALAAPDLALGLGGGASGLVGGNAGGYTVGPTQRLGLEVGVSPRHAVRVSVEHSHHRLADASGYLVDVAVPATAAVGARDYLVVEFAAKLGVGPAPRAEGFGLLPYTHLGVGVAATDTRLQLASLDGRTPLRSRVPLPLVDLGFGLGARVRPWVTLSPELRVQALLAEDVGEVDGQSNWGTEVRIVPTLDAHVRL